MNGLASYQKYLFLEIYDLMYFESFLENKPKKKPNQTQKTAPLAARHDVDDKSISSAWRGRKQIFGIGQEGTSLPLSCEQPPLLSIVN